MTDLERLIGELTAEQQRALLATLDEDPDGGPDQDGTEDGPGPQRLRLTRAPLSFAQLGLWFLHQLHPELPVYHVAYAITVPARAEPAAWRAALGDLMSRHEVLRTKFENSGDEPVQVVEPAPAVPFEVADLTALPAERLAAEADRLAREHARRPFELGTAPLLRAKLLLLGDTEHRLVLTMHHLVFDGWSVGVLLRELSASYRSRTGEQPAARPAEPPLQYGDYAAWQRERLTGDRLRHHLDHWRDRLAGMSVLDLPTDRPRPAIQRHRGRCHRFTVAAPVTRRLREVARDHGATTFMALLAAVHGMLLTHTASTDVTIAVPLAHRTRPELEPLIGLFLNTLPLRLAPVPPDPTFGQLLRLARSTTLAALPHQDLPFDQLVRDLHPHRTLSHQPISSVFLTVFPAADAETPDGWSVRPVDLGTARGDLTLAFEDGPDEIAVAIEYDSDLFEPATIARLGDGLLRLLASATDEPDRPLPELPLITDRERSRLAAWSAGPVTAFPRHRLVHELVAEQAAARPDAVAVVDTDRALSYGELVARSNRLARILRKRGVGPDVPVGCHLDRSPELIVALLAVLTAGGAYLPLDPDYPADRLRFMLADSGADLLLTGGGRRVTGWSGPVLDLDEVDLLTGAAAAPAPGTRPEHLAYLTYTSGSTGRPKGTGIPHRAVLRLIRDTDYIELTAADRVAHTSNLTFDPSTFEIWGALCNGGRVVLVPREAVVDPPALAAALRRHGVTAMFLTPQVFGQTVHAVPGAFAGVRHVIIGGDAVESGPVRAGQRATPDVTFVNGYGPTESTTYAVTHAIGPLPPDAVSVPIGRPIANTTAYVLDARLRTRPIGVPGELYLGGDGLARGYHGRPGLTAERFVPDPFGPAPGGRLYRTGDVARWLPSGLLEFLGRRDHQVKVRGYRIELGEIEARLAEHPAVAAAAAVVHEDGGERGLAAFVVPAGAERPGRRALTAWLAASLPAYMVPASITELTELPLTPNGKLDRAELARRPADPRGDGDFVAPRDDIERAVAAVWSEVLGVARIDVRDDFFAIGGHSLLATQAVGRLQTEFGIADRLPVRTLFEASTVERFAAAIVESMMAGLQPDRLDRMLAEHGAEPGEPSP